MYTQSRREASLPTYCKVVSALDIFFSLARLLFVYVVLVQAAQVRDHHMQTLLHLSAFMNGGILLLGPLGAISLFTHQRYAPYVQGISIALVLGVFLHGIFMNVSYSAPGDRPAMFIGFAFVGVLILGWVAIMAFSISKSLSLFRLIDSPRTATYEDLESVGPSACFQSLELGGNAQVNDRFCALFDRHRRLFRLGLAQTAVSDVGLRNLAWLRYLESLDLSRTAVTDASLSMLSGLTSLRTLDLTGTRCTEQGIADFEKQRAEHGLAAVEVRWGAAPDDMAAFDPVGFGSEPAPGGLEGAQGVESPAANLEPSPAPLRPAAAAFDAAAAEFEAAAAQARVAKPPVAQRVAKPPAAKAAPQPPAQPQAATDDTALNSFLSGLSKKG